MEKLQPLITHRFWVAFGLALLVPFVSWWIYNGSIQETISGRVSTLDSEFNKAKLGADTPNKTWYDGAAKLNEYEQGQYSQAASKLWLDQQNDEAMFWPKRMLSFVRDLEFGQAVEGGRSTEGRTIYQTEYDAQHRKRVLSQIDMYKDGKGLCEVNTTMVHRVPQATMQTSLPTWKQIWNAQEDEWLIAQLLKSIDNVNQNSGARSITESPVRQIHELLLYGGNLDNVTKSGKKKSSRGGGMGGSDYGRQVSGSGGGSPGGNSLSAGSGLGSSVGGAGKKAAIPSPDLDFDITKEFGSPAVASKKKKSGGSKGSFAGASGPTAGGEMRRYVHNKEGDKYKTRGFKTKLTIQQDKLPFVLAELTNSRWPVEVVRVHWEASNENGRKAAPVSGTGSLPAGGSLGGGNPYSNNGRSVSGSGGMGGIGLGGGSLSGGGSQASSNSGLGSFGSTEAENTDPLSASLKDPNLATVVIAGLITIFQVSEEDAAAMREMVKEKSEDVMPGGDAEAGVNSENGDTEAEGTPPADESATPPASSDSGDASTNTPAAAAGVGQ
jgi:hypothetical protein